MAETPERDPNIESERLKRNEATDSAESVEPLSRPRLVLLWIPAWPRWVNLTLHVIISSLLLVGLLGSSIVLYANLAPVWVSRDRIHDEVGEVPEFKVVAL